MDQQKKASFNDIFNIDPILDNIIKNLGAFDVVHLHVVNKFFNNHVHHINEHEEKSKYQMAVQAINNYKNFDIPIFNYKEIDNLRNIILITKPEDHQSVAILNYTLELFLQKNPEIISQKNYEEDTLVHLLAKKDLVQPLQTLLNFIPPEVTNDDYKTPPPPINRQFTLNKSGKLPQDLTKNQHIKDILNNALNSGWTDASDPSQQNLNQNLETLGLEAPQLTNNPENQEAGARSPRENAEQQLTPPPEAPSRSPSINAGGAMGNGTRESLGR